MAKVFIGMAVYNGQKTLVEAIDSVLNQSFTEFTLFISDDTSTDSTPEICRAYAEKDSRIRYYRQEKNLGMLPNLKFLLDQANGDLFTWVDADDVREKDFLKVCVEAIEKNNVPIACTVVADIDSYGRNIRELTELSELSGSPSMRQVAKFVLQPEIFGKGNLMYSVFKTDIAKQLWDISPQKMEWGSDYHFCLALISRFPIFIDNQVLFKKRVGGVSSRDASKNDSPIEVRRLVLKNPKNYMFPFGRFTLYFKGEMHALNGTPYKPLVAALLLIRLPRSFFIYLKGRNYRKFIGQLFKRSI